MLYEELLVGEQKEEEWSKKGRERKRRLCICNTLLKIQTPSTLSLSLSACHWMGQHICGSRRQGCNCNCNLSLPSVSLSVHLSRSPSVRPSACRSICLGKKKRRIAIKLVYMNTTRQSSCNVDVWYVEHALPQFEATNVGVASGRNMCLNSHWRSKSLKQCTLKIHASGWALCTLPSQEHPQ